MVDRSSSELLSLWDYSGPPPTTADTMSRAAAASVRSLAGTLRREVAAYVGEHGPVAEWVVEQALGLEGNTVRPRLWELRKAELVETSGRGITPSGRACHLYVLTARGRRALEYEEVTG